MQSLKRERIKRKIYSTRQDDRADVFDYIEVFTTEPAATVTWAVSVLRHLNVPHYEVGKCLPERGYE